MSFYRIIDVNLNRACEALRVIEELGRFYLEEEELTKPLKNLRHQLCKIYDGKYNFLLKERDSVEDIGREIPNPSQKSDFFDIYKANFKRLQQALRVLEEFALDEKDVKKTCEDIRYKSYDLEKKMHEKLTEKIKKIRLADKKLYLVTDRKYAQSQDEFLDKIASALKGGVGIVQLREKDTPAKEIIELGRKVKELCALYNALFIINDRPDIALILKADGVHLGQDDIDIRSAKHILGEDAIIGISTHCIEQASKAQDEGADYIGVGPVFSTPTKPGREAVGLDYVKWTSQNINIPCFAIGGIDLSNCQDVISSGASRLAVVRALINAESPEKTALEFMSRLNCSNELKV